MVDFKKLLADKNNDKLSNESDDLLAISKAKGVDVGDNQLTLPNGKLITLNDQQYDAIQKIRAWLKSDKTFLTLSGPAGCGKSTIIKKILDEYRGGVIVTAPTHRAKKVIAEITGKESKTIHSLLGLRIDVSVDEFDPNNPIFNPIAAPQICSYNWVILDESSMINIGLLNLIKEKTKNCKTKILFMGDIFQIPPIFERRSEVFFDPEIEKIELTKIERQIEGNPLLSLYDDLRNNIETTGGFSRKTNINDKGEGIVFTVDKKEFREKMFETYRSEEFKKDVNFVKTIAWRNETVMASNKIIRTELFGTNTDIVEINDIFTGYRTISNSKLTYNIIENSADYRVIDKSELRENSYGIKGFQVKLKEDLGKNKFKYDDVFIVDTKNHENLYLYGQMHDYFCDMGKSNKKLWPKYYDFRRNNILMCDIEKYADGTYRNSSNKIKRDLDYGFACTCHKVQGGTFNIIYVLESDIRLNWVQKEQNQIFYVAVSRPTKIAYVLTNKID